MEYIVRSRHSGSQESHAEENREVNQRTNYIGRNRVQVHNAEREPFRFSNKGGRIPAPPRRNNNTQKADNSGFNNDRSIDRLNEP